MRDPLGRSRNAETRKQRLPNCIAIVCAEVARYLEPDLILRSLEYAFVFGRPIRIDNAVVVSEALRDFGCSVIL